MCDSRKNPNLGPVNIVTKKAIQVKDELPLIIYSGPPQAAMYFYSTEFVYEGVLIQAGGYVNLEWRSPSIICSQIFRKLVLIDHKFD